MNQISTTWTLSWVWVLVVSFVLFPTARLAQAASKDLERVRIGYSVGGVIPFPGIFAKKDPFFGPAGFHPELVHISPTVAGLALVSGDTQYVVFARTDLDYSLFWP